MRTFVCLFTYVMELRGWVEAREGGGVCIVRHITAPDVQFTLQPCLNGGTDRKRVMENVGAMIRKEKRRCEQNLI